MHNFLKSIGFEQMNNTKLDELLNTVVEEPNSMNLAVDSQGNEFVEFTKEFGESIGIVVCGNYMENGEFNINYYYPYFKGSGITSEESIEIEKHAEKESYAAICDDIKVGVTLIFYMQNVAEYLMEKSHWKENFKPNFSVTLSGMSLAGKVLLPINKSEKQIERSEKVTQNRNHLIAAAREGDEDAIESLTLEDIDTYSMISKRIANEDILSIVDSYFMPYGIESDQYSVMGEILNCYYVDNKLTNQRVCVMTVDTNDLIYDICINEKDLLGEPKPGRRFKGTIWMQGHINF
ncbi:MAG: DUF3881 family protein [Lachnospiraceae bacterium]|nr:DUF3881 family protein [Lachnospiraceae bacterium]